MTKRNARFGRYLYIGGTLLAFSVVLGIWRPSATVDGAQPQSVRAPKFRVDPFWPKTLPRVKDASGAMQQWVTGEVGGSCADSHDHIFTLNRSWQQGSLGKLLPLEGTKSIPAPPVIAYDIDGNIVTSWGDASLAPTKAAAAMPESFHGCFVDYQDNVWIGGNADGIVQKYTHDGKLLLQIGTKGVCDGPPTLSPQGFYATCGSPGDNKSQTLLNGPADIAVDPDPDPVTGERGSVYIADGYGNHRVVVFDSKGKYLRQWGSAGSGPGQFVVTGGGHPHCVALGNDGLVYACDRGQHRVQVFDRTGLLKRIIAIDPEGFLDSAIRSADVEFSRDMQQAIMYDTDVGSGSIWILDRVLGKIIGGIGNPGHMAGEFSGVHTLATDSRGNIYAAEGGGGRRIQKFVKTSE